jgi:hypothetical protein
MPEVARVYKKNRKPKEDGPESIVLFTEDQAFSPSYFGLLPHPPPSVSKLDRRHIRRLRKRENLLTGGGGRGASGEKALSSINH